MKVYRMGDGRERWISVSDLARTIHANPHTLRRIISRNSEFFEGLYRRVTVTLGFGPQETIFLSQKGIIAILFSLQEKQMKDQGARRRVISFKRWAVDVLDKVIKGEELPAIDEELVGLLSVPCFSGRGDLVEREAERLGLSSRQVYRMLDRMRKEAGMNTTRQPRSDKGQRRQRA